MKIFVFILHTFAKIFKIAAKTFKTAAIRVNKLSRSELETGNPVLGRVTMASSPWGDTLDSPA